MSKIPTISVTKGEDESDTKGDNELNGFAGTHTDIEEIESNDESEIVMNLLSDKAIIKGLRSPFATDIEDYNDSCSEDEASEKYPVLKVSLQEFMNHGITEERTYCNEFDGSCEIREGNFMSLKKPCRIDDCPTDYENYSISSDDENFDKKSICIDLSLINIENNNTEGHIEQVKESDDDLSKSDCIDYFNENNDVCTSEDEILEVSAHEEVMQIACSTSEEDSIEEKYPTIDVTFTSDKKNQKNKCKSNTYFYLEVYANCEESLTDIEKIDLSTTEDSGEEDFIPIARAIVVDSTDNSATDIEEMNLSEYTRFSDDFENINPQHFPSPHREMVVIKEDKNGDPITHVLDMQNDFLFGLVDNSCDDMSTDIEDISSAIEESSDISTKEIAELNSTVENDVVILSENVKSVIMKRNEYIDNLTDTEEIFVSNLLRRKKCRSKTQNKSKPKQSHLLVAKTDQFKFFESDESKISSTSKASTEKLTAQCARNLSQDITSLSSDSVNEILNESYTVVHDKCVNMFNVVKEKDYIKGLKESLEQHTDVEYVEEELVQDDE